MSSTSASETLVDTASYFAGLKQAAANFNVAQMLQNGGRLFGARPPTMGPGIGAAALRGQTRGFAGAQAPRLASPHPPPLPGAHPPPLPGAAPAAAGAPQGWWQKAKGFMGQVAPSLGMQAGMMYAMRPNEQVGEKIAVSRNVYQNLLRLQTPNYGEKIPVHEGLLGASNPGARQTYVNEMLAKKLTGQYAGDFAQRNNIRRNSPEGAPYDLSPLLAAGREQKQRALAAAGEIQSSHAWTGDLSQRRPGSFATVGSKDLAKTSALTAFGLKEADFTSDDASRLETGDKLAPIIGALDPTYGMLTGGASAYLSPHGKQNATEYALSTGLAGAAGGASGEILTEHAMPYILKAVNFATGGKIPDKVLDIAGTTVAPAVGKAVGGYFGARAGRNFANQRMGHRAVAEHQPQE